MAMLIFLAVHWQASVFFQSFFLHRYGAHKQFTMSKRAERCFHFLAWLVMGSSYLSPRAYAILHRMHHAYSDTERDPHSPVHEPNFFRMMNKTKRIYRGLRRGTITPEPRFDGGYPSWPLLDERLNTMTTSVLWGTLYTLVYLAYAWKTHTYWVVPLAPLHWFLGPIHGAIVNYLGHKVGYRNFNSEDGSRNTLVFDVLTMGELFQNNHHRFSQSVNFGARWFEVDPAYWIIRAFALFGFVKLSHKQRARVADVAAERAEAETETSEAAAPIG